MGLVGYVPDCAFAGVAKTRLVKDSKLARPMPKPQAANCRRLMFILDCMMKFPKTFESIIVAGKL
jgi:hypothetical protein